jgi:hypothetical protein
VSLRQQAQLPAAAEHPAAMIRATSLLVALLVPVSADVRVGMPDALGVMRAAMIPFELPDPFFLVPRDPPLPLVIEVKSLRLCPSSVPASGRAGLPAANPDGRQQRRSLTSHDFQLANQPPPSCAVDDGTLQRTTKSRS